MNDSLPAELKFRENIGPGLRGEKMLTYAIWHGFLAAQPLDLFVEIDHNQLTQYCNLPIFSVNGMSFLGVLALQQTGLAVTKGC